MSLSSEFQDLLSKQEQIINRYVVNLHTELIRSTPVDTGTLKSAWELKKVSATHWVMSNNMEYADIIFRGIRAGVKGGSKQLPDGVYPILQRFNLELQEELQKLKG